MPLITGCTVSRALDMLVPGNTYRLEGNLAYGADARQAMDFYLPLHQRADAPVVVFFYGGNWTRGSRDSYRFVGESLAAAGIVTAVADYRLSPTVRWREILDDCASATAWVLENAPRFGGDRRKVFVAGHSAGAYNAAMLALDAKWLAAHRESPRSLAGWIGIAGPYDFLPIGDPETKVAFDWPDTPRASQPIAHVSPASPRALLLAAARDSVVDPVRNSSGLARELEAAGVPVRLRVFDRVNHATALGALAPPLRWLAPVRDEVVAFVSQSRGR